MGGEIYHHKGIGTFLISKFEGEAVNVHSSFPNDLAPHNILGIQRHFGSKAFLQQHKDLIRSSSEPKTALGRKLCFFVEMMIFKCLSIYGYHEI